MNRYCLKFIPSYHRFTLHWICKLISALAPLSLNTSLYFLGLDLVRKKDLLIPELSKVTVSWSLLLTPSFVKIFTKWLFTVFSFILSFLEICLLLYPWITSCTTSCSLFVMIDFNCLSLTFLKGWNGFEVIFIIILPRNHLTLLNALLKLLCHNLYVFLIL